MSTGAALGPVGLYTLWAHRGPWTAGRLQVARRGLPLLDHQLSAVAYPGTALFDRPHSGEGEPPRLRGPQTVIAGIALTLNTLAYTLERRRLSER